MSPSPLNLTICLDGIIYTKDTLSLLEGRSKTHTEVHNFLKDWFKPTRCIQVQTSGTTGKPKGILLSKKAMLISAKKTCTFFKLTKESKVLLALSPNHIAGKMMLVRALHAGFSLDVASDLGHPLKGLRHDYDFAALVPLQVIRSLDLLNPPHCVHTILVGGAPMQADYIKKLQTSSSMFFQSFGMTETASHVAIRALNGKNKSETYTALENIHFDINNDSQLIIEAPELLPNAIVTNDVVKLISKTSFIWLGRKDNVINSGGIKFFPELIEQKLNPYIATAFYITSKKDDLLGEKIIFITSTHNTLDDNTLNSIFSKHLSPFERPKLINRVPVIEFTKNGKVIRQ